MPEIDPTFCGSGSDQWNVEAMQFFKAQGLDSKKTFQEEAAQVEKNVEDLEEEGQKLIVRVLEGGKKAREEGLRSLQ